MAHTVNRCLLRASQSLLIINIYKLIVLIHEYFTIYYSSFENFLNLKSLMRFLKLNQIDTADFSTCYIFPWNDNLSKNLKLCIPNKL